MHFLTGIVPLLLANVIVMLITAALAAVKFKYLLIWLAISSMSLIAFYGMAVFCAMLTGNIVVLPVVYVVLNLTSLVVEGGIRGILNSFVFGMENYPGLLSEIFSPISGLYDKAKVYYDYTVNELIYDGMGLIAGYCIAGIVLMVLALMLYKIRNMETAGDIVAIPVLKPIFKYCMCFGTAIVAGTLGTELLYFAPGGAFPAFLFMLLGAFTGYFAAEMMMKKSLRVFGEKWKGLIISFCIIGAFVACFEFDVFGFEKRVPEPENVESVWLNSYEIKEEENIKNITELHKQIIKNKKAIEKEGDLYTNISYRLKNGKSISRRYSLIVNNDIINDPEAEVVKYQNILNSTEGILTRKKLRLPVTEENVYNAYITAADPGTYYNSGTDRSYVSTEKPVSISLTPKEICKLYNECILPDMKDGTIGKAYYADSEEYLDTATNIQISFELHGNDGEFEAYEADYTGKIWESFRTTLTTDARRTMEWVLENTDLEPMTEREFRSRINFGE